MNREPDGMPEGLAKLEYYQGEFVVVWPGQYVLCAVTGEKIGLPDLRYWSANRQEAYRDGETALKREMECKGS